jgi:hypothetical protein
MWPLDTQNRIDRRFMGEVGIVRSLMENNADRMRSLLVAQSYIQFEVHCRSAFYAGSGEAPAIADAWHRFRLQRPEGWPAERVTLQHLAPPRLFNPHILPNDHAQFNDEGQPIIGSWLMDLTAGLVCYGDAPADIPFDWIIHRAVLLLSYAAVNPSDDHLNAAAARWARSVRSKDPSFFPLDRPLKLRR